MVYVLVLILTGGFDPWLGCGSSWHGLGDTVASLGVSLALKISQLFLILIVSILFVYR